MFGHAVNKGRVLCLLSRWFYTLDKARFYTSDAEKAQKQTQAPCIQWKLTIVINNRQLSRTVFESLSSKLHSASFTLVRPRTSCERVLWSVDKKWRKITSCSCFMLRFQEKNVEVNTRASARKGKVFISRLCLLHFLFLIHGRFHGEKRTEYWFALVSALVLAS